MKNPEKMDNSRLDGRPISSITLVQPPIIKYEIQTLAPPVGLLRTAAYIREAGCKVSLVDLNLRGVQRPGWVDSDLFFEEAAAMIAEYGADAVGLTSMSMESGVCLELAQRLKHDHGKIIILGGPHFTSIAREVVSFFPWVDYVVCGDGELPMARLIERSRTGDQRNLIPNVAERTPFGVQLTRNQRELEFSDIPQLPAYELVDLNDYFGVNPEKLLHIDNIRGCNLKCSFCYSAVHWGHKGRYKSITRTVDELAHYKSLGARMFFFVGDNFLNDTAYALALCQEMIERKISTRWYCYATLAQLKEPVVAVMGKSGCRSVFVGIDAISLERKKEFGKQYYKGWEQLKAKLELCKRNSICPTFALMVSPEYSDREIEEILLTALLIVLSNGHILINYLCLYNKTSENEKRTSRKRRSTSTYVSTIFDTHRKNHGGQHIDQYPWLFPMHSTWTYSQKETDMVWLVLVSQMMIRHFPIVLMRLKTDFDVRLVDIVTDIVDMLKQRNADAGDKEALTAQIVSLFTAYVEQKFPAGLREIMEIELYQNGSNVEKSKKIIINIAGVKMKFRLRAPKNVYLPCGPPRLKEGSRIDDYERRAGYYIGRVSNLDRWLKIDDENIRLLEKLAHCAEEEEIGVDRETYFKLVESGIVQ